jgi:hypothetical protein
MNREIDTTEIHDIMFPCDILHGDNYHLSSDIERKHRLFMQMIQNTKDKDEDQDKDEEQDEDQDQDEDEDQDEVFMPPAPYSSHLHDEDEDDYINLIIYPYNPDFSFITDDDTKHMISSAYNCVMNKDAWKNIKNFKGESYMFSNDTKINQLMNDIDSMYEGGHSGASIGWTMRQIERIAYIGFDKFKNEWILIQKMKEKK